MALSGLDIYKLLPKTNCRQCGFVTCLAFAMQLAKKAVSIDKCPYLSEEAKRTLEASSLPPIKLISIGTGEDKLEIGNETVLFRHEEKFFHPCGLGFIVDDSLSQDQLRKNIEAINKLEFERIGQKIKADLIAIKQNDGKEKFVQAVKLVSDNTHLGLVLMSDDLAALAEALAIVKDKRPLVYHATENNLEAISKLAQEFKVPLVVSAPDLQGLSNLTQKLNHQGVSDLVLDTGNKSIQDRNWDLTQERRQGLKKSNRSLGYPVLAVIEQGDIYAEAIEAATYIAKYAGIILIRGIEPWEVLPLLTLRQNIYTDPQKPLQIEPKAYSVGQVSDKSPVLITTNFSLTYYTVLSEVEASKVPVYIISVDTE